ncbi:thiamine pyrophosphate-binding protein [Nesterenkonia marinintestina]|uniref:thiamine pyrophosphate-binding protein n=1 Tax=Nesterenkonia marinintestina TaxID=2979865 RepID=UPI0021C22BEE|nr:thiamine pyrophosphate-binding protein [Nesterenkonia sp. GX14115]
MSETPKSPHRHVGAAIAESLVAHDVRRVFSVPGESFLAVLDGLHDTDITNVVTRHEGGAAYMAEAHGKLTGRPGVALVTRGPGAANAFVAVHTAWQDGTPMVLFVGLVPVSDRGRESFQEFDTQAWFGTQTKRVLTVEDPARASDVVAEAFFAASSGRPGPVIVGLPEDVIRAPFDRPITAPLPVAEGGLSHTDVDEISRALSGAERPLLYLGGPRWTPEASARTARFAEEHGIPVVHEWRATDRIPYSSPVNAGWLGYGRAETPAQMFEEADVVLAVGAVPSDVPTDGYTLRQRPEATTIIVAADPALQGLSGPVTRHVLASPTAFGEALDELTIVPAADWEPWCRRGVEAHRRSSVPTSRDRLPEIARGTAHMAVVMEELRSRLPEDVLTTFGAGNHCVWAQYHMPTEVHPAQLSTRNGSMGYSVPAAVAAALEHPDRFVVAVTGDGEFLMNGQELATAAQFGAAFLVIIVDNGEYGTIRAHQERDYPDRISGTQIANPDFAAYGQAFGGRAELIADDADAAGAVERAVRTVTEERRTAVLHVLIDQSMSTP